MVQNDEFQETKTPCILIDTNNSHLWTLVMFTLPVPHKKISWMPKQLASTKYRVGLYAMQNNPWNEI